MYILHITDIVANKGITYYELAERLGITRTTLISYITSKNPKIDILDRLAIALDCSIADLVEFHPYKGKGSNRPSKKTKKQMRQDMKFHDRLCNEIREAQQMMEEANRIQPIDEQLDKQNDVEDVFVDANYQVIENEDDKTITLNKEDEILFNALKALRLKIANEVNKPAFVIFSDKTLRQMAKNKPLNMNEFLQLIGVGSTKLELYGKSFIDMINNYLDYK